MTGLNELADEAHATATTRGWWAKGEPNFGEQLMLVVTEVAEAMERWRKGQEVDKASVKLTYSAAHKRNAKPPLGWSQIVAGSSDGSDGMNWYAQVDQKEECPFTKLTDRQHLQICGNSGESTQASCGGTDMITYQIDRLVTTDELVKYYGFTAEPDSIPDELADIIIRVLDICGGYGVDIEAAVRDKMAFNKTRPFLHGGKRA